MTSLTAASPAPVVTWELRLYVAGQTARSLQAFANLKRICEERLPGCYKIEVVDLLKNLNLPKATRSSQFRLWFENFRNRCGRSSEVFPIRNVS